MHKIRAKKAPNTTVQKLCQEKKSHKFEPKKTRNTTLQTLCLENINAQN